MLEDEVDFFEQHVQILDIIQAFNTTEVDAEVRLEQRIFVLFLISYGMWRCFCLCSIFDR